MSHESIQQRADEILLLLKDKTLKLDEKEKLQDEFIDLAELTLKLLDEEC